MNQFTIIYYIFKKILFKEKVIFPEVAITKNNEWRYIIQDLDGDSNFKQGIRIETCE